VRTEIVAVGTELLLGQIDNTNARWISERLAEIGVDVLRHLVVGDNQDRMVRDLRAAAARSDVVIVTGGLGPTQDDVTRPALAAAAGVRLVRRPEIEVRLRERWAATGREMPEANLLQADVPEGGRSITPIRGTAPGLVVEVEGATVYALPGVPAEMREMMQGTVLPELAARVGPSALVSRTLRCVGMAESRIAELLDDLFHGSANPTVAYLAGRGEVRVRLTAKADTREAAERLIAPLSREVAARLGDVVYGTGDEELEAVVGRMLLDAGLTLAAAESLTGGSLAARITSVPGASAYFLGSAVTYDVDAKRTLLGVSARTLREDGPVSRACATEMATGARRLFGADVAVGLTGAAGPEPHGGAEPGRVWVALETTGERHQRGLRWPGDRELVRRFAEQAALDLVRRHLAGLPLPD
jgi:nicotinamide-nucleotide amidase